MDRDDFKHLPAPYPDEALVARLAATAGIKAGSIEGDGILSGGNDDRLSFKTVIVLQIETRGSARLHGLAAAADFRSRHGSIPFYSPFIGCRNSDPWNKEWTVGSPALSLRAPREFKQDRGKALTCQ
jgi:hypothetical protein